MLIWALYFALLGRIDACFLWCLKCVEGECVLCDYPAGYRLVTGRCLRALVDGCEIHGLDGACLRCEQNRYFEPASGHCVFVSREARVNGCSYYS